MKTESIDIEEYRKQLKKGSIQKAYRGLMKFLRNLRAHFQKQYPDCFVSSDLYAGQMDITFFAFVPELLKQHQIKTMILFVHDDFHFEIWLAARNKNIQAKVWTMLKKGGWNKHPLVTQLNGVDYITRSVLVKDPDFSDQEMLTKQIEQGVLEFTRDVEGFLASLK